jgi:hypothetical protein
MSSKNKEMITQITKQDYTPACRLRSGRGRDFKRIGGISLRKSVASAQQEEGR